MKKQNPWKTSIAPFLTAALLCIGPSVAASDTDERPKSFYDKISDGNCQSDAIDEALLLANQDNSTAQNFLGTVYLAGSCVRQNDIEALRWFRLAAEQGDAQAQFNIGLMYYAGNGVEIDYAQAVHWFRLAAEQGYEKAQAALSSIPSAP